MYDEIQIPMYFYILINEQLNSSIKYKHVAMMNNFININQLKELYFFMNAFSQDESSFWNLFKEMELGISIKKNIENAFNRYNFKNKKDDIVNKKGEFFSNTLMDIKLNNQNTFYELLNRIIKNCDDIKNIEETEHYLSVKTSKMTPRELEKFFYYNCVSDKDNIFDVSIYYDYEPCCNFFSSITSTFINVISMCANNIDIYNKLLPLTKSFVLIYASFYNVKVDNYVDKLKEIYLSEVLNKNINTGICLSLILFFIFFIFIKVNIFLF